MASIAIDPSTQCIKLVCGAGESDVSFTVPAIYRAWKDWFVLSDNSKYLPAFDSAGGDPVGASALDNVYFLHTDTGWLICPQTVETEVIIRIDGNLFPYTVGDPMFGYDFVVADGHTHIETTVSTSARQIETGISGVTPADIDAFASAAWAEPVEGTYTAAQIMRIMASALAGKTSGQPTTPVFRNITDTADAITATVDTNGNRTAITLNP